jgi:hypothetical protein
VNKHFPSDVQTAVEFLAALRPNGPWNLSAIAPDRPGAESTVAHTPDEAKRWLAERAGKANLYYGVNPAPNPSGAGGRARKSDVTSVEYVHVDVDTDKAMDGLTLAERKTQTVAKLEACIDPGPPTHIIDSGGGIQAVWRVEGLDADTAERANRAIIDQFGGDTGTHDVGRLLRLPGPMNLPDAKKRARGRTPVEAKLVLSAPKRRYIGIEFPLADPPQKTKTTDLTLGPPEDVENLEALVGERVFAIVRDGRLPEAKDGDDSRSAWLFDGVCGLLRAGLTPEQVLGVLSDPRWGIAESVLERDTDADRYAQHTVRSAIALVAAEPSDTSFDDDLDIPEALTDDKLADRWKQNYVAIGQIAEDEIPPIPWLVEGLLIEGEVTIVAGMGAVGKSLHAWSVGIGVALGIPMLGWPQPAQRRRRVLVLSAEDDRWELERRVVAACRLHGLDRTKLDDRFIVRSVEDRRIRLATRDPSTGKVKRSDIWHEVRWAIQHQDVGLVIIDPVVKMGAGFDENSNDDQELLFAVSQDLLAGSKCSMMVVDHFAKSGSGGDQSSVRGAGAKVNFSRVTVTMAGMTQAEYETIKPPKPREAYVRLDGPKANYSRKHSGRWLELVEQPVGTKGVTSVALRLADLESVGDFIEPETWEHREAFLKLVADGRDNDAQSGWPWCTTLQGRADTRLDKQIAAHFKLTLDQAQDWIAAFEAEGFIERDQWTSPKRNKSEVWRVVERPA